MNILVIGRGGREHSIVMKLAESERVSTIYAAPGNAGMQQAECIGIDEMDIEALVAFAKEEQINLTIVGPENPLNEGIADRFIEAGLQVFAPQKAAALLEGSKSFAKEFMKKYAVPTAAYATFTSADEAKQYIEKQGVPIVIKADGLAAGKGVIVAETKEQALAAVDEILVEKAFAGAGAKIVVEEFLSGKEFSLMAFVHEHNVYPMVPARDHKRAFDNDEGPNTGGMGAFSPVPDVTDDHLDFAMKEILQKTADGMMKEGRAFTGILYAGLMMTEDGPKVIEFNTRFGDPETQVVLPLLKNDLDQVILDVMDGKDPELQWEDAACVGVVLASQGYPGSYAKGVDIPVLSESETYTVHAGTKQVNGNLVSDGGRVLLVGSKENSFELAREKVYQALDPVENGKNYFYRTDIGK
ncbi:phosphoribosylamine--glycine ligase [Oceanobacillus jordanicus]|uniref:Phosphoribosylamine--glycine ligase n=1 Tax=Oceanobacillus jordanicus TaxID=2867266 RepID=A0AAW5B5J7_9BACI|nr:phosphoribosylamine--glycine ligase [Oceanobacillus jordanicus]MCG3419784.1 phosphoribosylamine--glycine ligase [Oceanobacillus jordanicus]